MRKRPTPSGSPTCATRSRCWGTPAENATESVEITLRRSDLNTQLSQLLAPVLAAEEARSRASGLIAEIDSTLRTRQTDALLAIGPSPVNPVYWAAAWNEVKAALNAMRAEFRSNYTNELRQFEFRQNLLVIIPLFLLGLILMLRGRAWATGVVRHLRAHAGRAAEPLAFVASLSKSLAPWIGLLLLVQSLLATGFFGLKGETLLQQIPHLGRARFMRRIGSVIACSRCRRPDRCLTCHRNGAVRCGALG